MPNDEASAPPSAAAGYEFNAGENKVFESLARNARRVGFWFEIYGALMLLIFVFGLIPKQWDRVDTHQFAAQVNLWVPRIDVKDGVVNIDGSTLRSGIVFFLLGKWSRRAGAGFNDVATTEGGDIGHLMRSLENLSKLYGFLRTVIVIVVCFIVVPLAVMMTLILIGSLTGALVPTP